MLAHVAAAVLLLEDYPATAQQYAAVAKRMAGRNAAVRETLGMCAYQAGDFETALREFKAAGRISGRDDLVPLIADCERALGRPERALEIASAPVTLNQADRVELRLVAAGARMDLGQPGAAARMLRGPLLGSDEVGSMSARIKYVYASALLADHRADEAREWFLRAAQADVDGETDAAEQAMALGAPSDEESSGVGGSSTASSPGREEEG